jgi:hypothetical protein
MVAVAGVAPQKMARDASRAKQSPMPIVISFDVTRWLCGSYDMKELRLEGGRDLSEKTHSRILTGYTTVYSRG